nr:RIO-like kinase [Ipomoea batatas]GMC71960.1 RIO-like kinase [Ipomoea batatas]GMC74177.1 RIO-like kinase [Ipomoea batatas]GMC75423.1 RIO-like kinase [Ipomoea batatas]GMD07622.1 RIO-like kinase [Ipomoea batatas]
MISMAAFQLVKKPMFTMLQNQMGRNLQSKFTRLQSLYLRIEIAMFRVTIGSDMDIASITPGKWLRHGLRKK